MGDMIGLDDINIVPSQRSVLPDSVASIVHKYLKDPRKAIIPLRAHPHKSNTYIVFDGHHTLCASEIINEFEPGAYEAYGWIAKDKADLILPEQLPESFYKKGIKKNNKNIRDRYNGILYKISESDMPQNISDLRSPHPRLRSLQDLLKGSFFETDLSETSPRTAESIRQYIKELINNTCLSLSCQARW